MYQIKLKGSLRKRLLTMELCTSLHCCQMLLFDDNNIQNGKEAWEDIEGKLGIPGKVKDKKKI